MKRNNVASPAVRQAQQLVDQGRAVDAYRLLEQAAGGGDGSAAFLLGQWRMIGDPVRRDLVRSREFFGRAAELGHEQAIPVYAALLANGAGGSGRRWGEGLELLRTRAARDPSAQIQLALIDQMKLDAEGNPAALPPVVVKAEAPRIWTVDALLTNTECDYLRRRAGPLLQPAVIVHPTTGQLVADPIRTSASAAFPFMAEDPAIHAINRRIAAVTRTTYEQGEPVQVLRYRPGEQFKLHNDALPYTDNQRVLTLLVYLNADYRGGETAFPAIDLSHRGRTGDAILFSNVDAEGRPDPASRHSGQPVTAGEKFILSKWIRAKPLDLTGPPGRPL
jgi:prolyl 4-hydroxylase